MYSHDSSRWNSLRFQGTNLPAAGAWRIHACRRLQRGTETGSIISIPVPVPCAQEQRWDRWTGSSCRFLPDLRTSRASGAAEAELPRTSPRSVASYGRMRLEQFADDEDPAIRRQETTLDLEPQWSGSACCVCETGWALDGARPEDGWAKRNSMTRVTSGIEQDRAESKNERIVSKDPGRSGPRVRNWGERPGGLARIALFPFALRSFD